LHEGDVLNISRVESDISLWHKVFPFMD
jgi:hypothetical protein